MQDSLDSFITATVDIAIMALMCVSMFGGPPAFETSKARASVPPAAASTR